MRALIAAAALFTMACAAAAIGPAALRLGEDACAYCRMTVVSRRTAAQIVVAAEEPLIFDEIGCLGDYLANHDLPKRARVFVTDHRTSAWLDASAAIFTQTSIDTPMSSGLLVHADAASRDADPAARGGRAVNASEILHGRAMP